VESIAREEAALTDQPFGAPVGKLDDPSSHELKNEFTTIPSQSLESMFQSSRVQPHQIGTGVMRGTQRIVNGDGSYITLGAIPDSTPEEYGIAFFSSDGSQIFKLTGEAIYFYDKNNDNNNIIQIGKLTNGEYGAAFAKSGDDLVEALED
jgi:hypothetical protein